MNTKKNQFKEMAGIIVRTALTIIAAEILFSVAVENNDAFSLYFFFITLVIATASNLIIRKVAGDIGIDENGFYSAIGLNMLVMLSCTFSMYFLNGMKNTFLLASIVITTNFFFMTFAQHSIFPSLDRENKEDLWWTKRKEETNEQ